MSEANGSTDNVTAESSASEQSDKLQKTSPLKKVALPASVIFMACFCGFFACGVTCSVLGSPVHTMPRDEQGGFTWTTIIVIAVLYIVSPLVGLYVGKGVIRRHRGEQK